MQKYAHTGRAPWEPITVSKMRAGIHTCISSYMSVCGVQCSVFSLNVGGCVCVKIIESGPSYQILEGVNAC